MGLFPLNIVQASQSESIVDWVLGNNPDPINQIEVAEYPETCNHNLMVFERFTLEVDAKDNRKNIGVKKKAFGQ